MRINASTSHVLEPSLSASQAEGRGFESRFPLHNNNVIQSVYLEKGRPTLLLGGQKASLAYLLLAVRGREARVSKTMSQRA
ncbi:MAG: hypothetical protein IMW95_12905 [Moorella humiferrea]|nr:hypothetical protein [Moorella humiferrea]